MFRTAALAIVAGLVLMFAPANASTGPGTDPVGNITPEEFDSLAFGQYWSSVHTATDARGKIQRVLRSVGPGEVAVVVQYLASTGDTVRITYLKNNRWQVTRLRWCHATSSGSRFIPTPDRICENHVW